jgi:dual oxidase maturation factor 1
MPWWQCGGPVSVQAPIRVQDTEAMNLTLEVHVGLNYVNITQSKCTSPTENRGGSTSTPATRFPPADHWILRESERSGVIKFNERIELKTAEDMRVQFREALERGLPVPILTVINYLSHQEESFRWSVDYRRAGFFASSS